MWLTHRTSNLEKAALQEPRHSCFWSLVTFCPPSSCLTSPASCLAPDITPTVQSRETSEGQAESGGQEGRAGEVPTRWEALALGCSGASVCPESCAPEDLSWKLCPPSRWSVLCPRSSPGRDAGLRLTEGSQAPLMAVPDGGGSCERQKASSTWKRRTSCV